MRRYVKLAAVGAGMLLVVWVGAVRSAAEVKARKAARRAARGA
jgi:hypothetical protein